MKSNAFKFNQRTEQLRNRVNVSIRNAMFLVLIALVQDQRWYQVCNEIPPWASAPDDYVATQ